MGCSTSTHTPPQGGPAGGRRGQLLWLLAYDGPTHGGRSRALAGRIEQAATAMAAGGPWSCPGARLRLGHSTYHPAFPIHERAFESQLTIAFRLGALHINNQRAVDGRQCSELDEQTAEWQSAVHRPSRRP